MPEMSGSDRWENMHASFDKFLAEPAGQAIVIEGPVRSGKSTLLRRMVMRGERAVEFHVEGEIYRVGQNDLPKKILEEIGNWSSGQVPRIDARSIVVRLGLSVRKYGDLHRRVVGVDAKPEMAASFLRWWLPIIRELPEKVKFIFTQRPDGILVNNKEFMSLPNVVLIPLEATPESEEEKVESEVVMKTVREVLPVVWTRMLGL